MTIELKTEVVKYTAEHAGCRVEIERAAMGWSLKVWQDAPWCYATMVVPTQKAAEEIATMLSEAFAGVQV